MIKFFRQIRQNMIKENKARNYVLYAIGEIVLVVIGILIAVSINDWNEEIKYKNNEKEILSALNTEFTENLELLKKSRNRNDSTIKGISIILKLMNQSIENSFSSNQIDSLLLLSITDETWIPSAYALQKVNILAQEQNSELLSSLYDWSRNMVRVQESELNATDAVQEIIAYIKQNGSLRHLDTYARYLNEGKSTLTNGNTHLLADPVFENIMDDAIVYTRQKDIIYKTSIEKIEAILTLTTSN